MIIIIILVYFCTLKTTDVQGSEKILRSLSDRKHCAKHALTAYNRRMVYNDETV